MRSAAMRARAASGSVGHRAGVRDGTGFVGSVSYRLDRLGERGVRALNVLADFAMYCGTGSKKAQGAGQTRRVR